MCIFHFVENQNGFCFNGNFLTRLCRSDLSFLWNVLTHLNLIFETSAHEQIAISHYYIFCATLLTRYEFEAYIEDTFWRFYTLDYTTFYKNVFWFVKFTKFVKSKCQLYSLLKGWHF